MAAGTEQNPPRHWRFRGLALRIGAIVLGASLLTSLLMTWVSVESTRDVLQERVEQHFPERVTEALLRVSFWYRERELDLSTFARSEVLAGGRSPDAEVQRYLAYVLESTPAYASLFLLPDDPTRPGVFAGAPVALERPDLALLRGTRKIAIGPVAGAGRDRRQIVSAPIPGGAGSLHAVLRLEVVDALLAAATSGLDGELVMQTADGSVISPPGAGAIALPGGVASGRVFDATDESGRPVLASAVHWERLGWDLVMRQLNDTAFAAVDRAAWRSMLIHLLVALVSSALAFGLGLWRLAPIRELVDGARRLADGDTTVRVDERAATDEVQILARSFNEMASRLHESRLELEWRHQELIRANEVLEQLSITDGLTKLHNHRYFQDQLAREAARAGRTGRPLALVLIDVDDFKLLNDEFGHAVGDAVLAQAADTMLDQIRDSDCLARYGGEEFALLAPDTDRIGAIALAEKVAFALAAARFDELGNDRGVTVSCGVALLEGSSDATFARADRALYQAKSNGKNCVMMADAEA